MFTNKQQRRYTHQRIYVHVEDSYIYDIKLNLYL